MSVCVSCYAFRPLTTYGDETWHGGRGQGPIISEGHQRSKVGSNFKLLRLSSNLGRDAGSKASAECLSRTISSQVK